MNAWLGSIDWLTVNLCLYRIGYEAFGVSFVMHRLNVTYGRQRIPDKDNHRTERYPRDCEFAGGIFGHDAFGIVNIAVDAEATFRSDGEEPEHVTTR